MQLPIQPVRILSYVVLPLPRTNERKKCWQEGELLYECIALCQGESIQSHFTISIEIDGHVIRLLPDHRPITIPKMYEELYLGRLWIVIFIRHGHYRGYWRETILSLFITCPSYLLPALKTTNAKLNFWLLMWWLGNAGAASPSSSLFGKPRGLTKSNTMAANANRTLGPGTTSVGRRSTIGYESKSSSSEKTNAIGSDALTT